MTVEAKDSGTPWHRAGNEQVAYVVDNDRELVFELVATGDSYTEEEIGKLELTLRAVNNHESLVAACEAAVRFLDSAATTTEDENNLYTRLRDAIAKAKSE